VPEGCPARDVRAAGVAERRSYTARFAVGPDGLVYRFRVEPRARGRGPGDPRGGGALRVEPGRQPPRRGHHCLGERLLRRGRLSDRGAPTGFPSTTRFRELQVTSARPKELTGS